MFDRELSVTAFNGKEAFLRECAMATDLDGPPLPNRRRPSTYVYFIAAERGPIKIGKARQPYARLQNLQTAHPEQLFVLAFGGGGDGLERSLHKEFADYRMAGEWFHRSDPILRRIIEWQEAELAEIDRLSTPVPATEMM